LRGKLSDYTAFWLSKQPTTSDELKKEYQTYLSTRPALKTTAGAENPNYVLFWTNEDLLTLQSFQITGQTDSILNPSSTILLEFTEDAGTLNVSGYVNDQQVQLVHCGPGVMTCSA
jgi:hypothetical protein